MKKTAFTLQVSVFITLIVIALAPGRICAQVVDQWQSLKRIPAGQKLEVIQTNAMKRTVQLIEATDNGLRVRFEGSELAIARADIEKITRIDSRLTRRLFIGLAIGGGGGAIGGAAMGAKYAGNEGGGTATWTGAAAGAGAAVGAAIGALSGLNAKRTVVYEKAVSVR